MRDILNAAKSITRQDGVDLLLASIAMGFVIAAFWVVS